VATEITMTDGLTFVTAEKMEAVIQNLERRSFAKIPLEDGRAIYVNPVQVVCVRES
jgi:hypothetical protein